MLKTKVKISKVNNLTDARYFAAMGADYLGFCCNTSTERYCSPARIKEITDWVEGPQFVLEFDGWQSEDDIKAVLETNLGQALHFGTFATYQSSFSIPVFQDFIFENIHIEDFSLCDFPVIRSDKSFNSLTKKEIKTLVSYMEAKLCFLDIDLRIEDIKPIFDHVPVHGLILRGGDEERLGVKSFEQLDEIFNALED